MLITYLVSSLEDAGDAVRASKKGDQLKVTDLLAAKHIKTPLKVPTTGEGRLYFNKSPYHSQFTAWTPPKYGSRVEFSGDLPQSLLELAKADVGSFYEVDTWTTGQASFSVDHLVDFPIPEVFAAEISWANGTATLQIWETAAKRNELVKNAEVGILKIDSESEIGDIILSGRVRNVPEDEKSAPIMFHHIPKWRPAEGSSLATLSDGMHPSLQLEVKGDAPDPRCKLIAWIELPSAIFVDQFQLDDLQGGSLLGLWGSTDLEAPIWMVETGSTALIVLEDGAQNYSIPLHLRYERPQTQGVPNPTYELNPHVFWVCPDTVKQESRHMETFFPAGSAFYSVQSNPVEFSVPAIAVSTQGMADIITAITVMLGTLLILWSLYKKSR